MRIRPFCVVAALVVLWIGSGCQRGAPGSGAAVPETIRIEGSDTMVNLAQAWAERYHHKHSYVSVQVQGGGSGVGIASLTDGNCDIAASSRPIRDNEAQRIEAARGEGPVEHIVGFDALAIYVHPSNPIDTISIEELAEIYGEGGRLTNWSQLGGPDIPITRVSRQNNSGTYAYFREAVLGSGREYKLGSIEQSGSKDVVALVANTPGAIGYSGMGYATDAVKLLKVSRKKGEEGYAASIENVLAGHYPITRPLYLYTVGEESGVLAEFLGWIMSAEGQTVVRELGYVPFDKRVKLSEMTAGGPARSHDFSASAR